MIAYLIVKYKGFRENNQVVPPLLLQTKIVTML